MEDARVRDILDLAADLPVAEREAYLDLVCGTDAPLRAEVQSLLAALSNADKFLTSPTIQEAQTQEDIAHDQIDQSIGPYRLLKKIGEGGMGIVYAAEQERPVRRLVALKIIKPGMDSNSVIARFSAERQALAMMDHTNIARVYDAGTTPTGRPYFVMELVQGVPVTQYCDINLLTPEQRLKLFISICQAVQHAHQKGIIHRDLKPSNVLVGVEDGKPVVKVIDFGIAKAIDQQLTERKEFTHTGMLVGTPEYMSPEQAAADSTQIDTRSDVYSLGVLLYELMTGTTPLDRKQLLQAGYEQMMRTIRESDPPRPSTRLGETREETASASAMRKMEPRRLARLLIGDLDVIIMKCLEKERDRRYDTASGLAQDIERFLNQDPVEARAPSIIYVLGKFTRKYRRTVITSAVFVLMLVGFLVTTSVVFWVLKGEASRQRDVAETARTNAETARRGEAIAKNDAIASEQDAIAGRNAAEVARASAQVESYFASIFAADAAVKADNFGDAHEFLSNAPEPLRGWEWNYLQALTDPQLLTAKFPSIDGVQYFPDRSEVGVVVADFTNHFLDAATLRELRVDRNLRERRLRTFAISPDQKRIIAEGRDFSICVLDENGRLISSIPAQKEAHTYVYSTRFTRDHSRFITSCRDDNSVHVWDTQTCRELLKLKGNIGLTISTCLTRDDSKLLTGSNQGVAQVWDLTSGQLLSTHSDPHAGWFLSVFSPDGTRVLSTTSDLTSQGVIWDAATGKDILQIKNGILANANLGVDFSPDGRMVAISGGRGAAVYDSQTGAVVTRLLGNVQRTPGVTFIGDGSHLITGGDDNTLRLWALHPMPQPLVFGDPTHRVSNARFDTNDGFLITESGSLPGRRYSLSNGLAAESPVPSVTKKNENQTLTHDSKRYLTACADGTVQLHDRATGNVLLSFGEKGEVVDRIIIAPFDDRAITYHNGSPAHLWDLASGHHIATIAGGSLPNPSGDDGRSIETTLDPAHREPYVFSHDAKHIATPVSRGILIFDAASGRKTGEIWIQHAVVHSVAFSPDDTQAVVSCEDECAEICDLKTMRPIELLYGHQGCVTGAVYSPDGTRILTCSLDKTARLWDSHSGRELLVLGGHTDAVFKAEFSHDGTRILTVSDDGTARVWDSLSPEQRMRGSGVFAWSQYPLHHAVSRQQPQLLLESGSAMGGYPGS